MRRSTCLRWAPRIRAPHALGTNLKRANRSYRASVRLTSGSKGRTDISAEPRIPPGRPSISCLRPCQSAASGNQRGQEQYPAAVEELAVEGTLRRLPMGNFLAQFPGAQANCHCSERNFHSSENASRRARREECRIANSIGIGSERPGNEITGIVERRRVQLRRGVITMIEYVIDLDKEPQVFYNLIMRSHVGYAVAGRKAGAQIVDSIRLIQIVFVAAGE